MKILITGGTGFVGSHAVAGLTRAGHDVRLLVRDPKRIPPALEPLGVEGVEHFVGDVLDEASVEAAMDGVEAVLHGASVYSIQRRDAGKVRRTNVRGTELVLDAARRNRLDPIVYVSSFAAFLPVLGATIGPDDPPGEARWPYAHSKAESERVARARQEEGAPVVIVAPGMVWGPNDPHFGESSTLARNILKGRLPFLPSGGVPLVDVRDLADPIAATFVPNRGARRYLLGGNHIEFKEVARTLCRAARRRHSLWIMPKPMGRLVGWMLEGALITMDDAHTDDSRARTDLGFAPRPAEDSLADTVSWMIEEGHIARAA
jgi:dihydroflavonol-4-reductase